MSSVPTSWNPTKVRFQKQKLAGNSLTVIVETDAGEGYLKVPNNKHSPHGLVCELVGTELARLIGLPTFDFALLPVPEFLIELANGAEVRPGPGFVTRSQEGMQWSGSSVELNHIVNPQDLGRLVVFDTWTLNCDRFRPEIRGSRPRWYAPRNVFLSREGVLNGRFRLTAMDHDCCFKCQGDLTPAHLRKVENDQTLYGRFPEFGNRARREDALAAVNTVESVARATVEEIIARVPREWERNDAPRAALVNMIYGRIRSLRRIIEDGFPAADLTDDLSQGGNTHDARVLLSGPILPRSRPTRRH